MNPFIVIETDDIFQYAPACDCSVCVIHMMNQILGHELDCREEKNRAKLMKWAEFPQYLTLDQFKVAEQSAIGDKQLNVLKELSWVEEHFTLIMMGPPGVGNYRKFLFMERIKRIFLNRTVVFFYFFS